MRVIAGSARGKKLSPVPGMDTRPTTDRVKESVFNILQQDVPGAVFLDLFGGTGQMGIEALSRGAAKAIFVDEAPAAMRVIRKNLAAARMEERARTMQCGYETALRRLMAQSVDVIFLDPPYGGELLNSALRAIEVFDILRAGGIILCESATKDEIACPESFAVAKTYRYGGIQLTALRRRADAKE